MKDDLQLYASMLRIRRISEAIASRYREQNMRCPVHLSIGQEAIATGVTAVLDSSDVIFSAHRPHAHYLARGGSLKSMLAELQGKATGCAGGRGGSMHLKDDSVGFKASVPIVGSVIPIAVGAALAIDLLKEQGAAIVFVGDGATEEGVWSESLDLAALKNLPVLFIIENNLYSVYTRITERQAPMRSICGIAEAHGVRAEEGDGNDVLAVQALTDRAIERARNRLGPQLLEFQTYRFLEHCGPDDDEHLGYRPAGELAEWKMRDPLTLFERELISRGVLTQSGKEIMELEISAELEAAWKFAHDSPFPEQEELIMNITGSIL